MRSAVAARYAPAGRADAVNDSPEDNAAALRRPVQRVIDNSQASIG